uniref:Uncharacterized protein n=1 Tax=Romanomermis culicivorax TaxID=13658 RepID=A0A915JT43_ROMCU
MVVSTYKITKCKRLPKRCRTEMFDTVSVSPFLLQPMSALNAALWCRNLRRDKNIVALKSGKEYAKNRTRLADI